MALTPEDIEQHIFKVSRRGYDKVEVDRFMGEVAKSYREVQQRIDEVSAGTEATADATVGSPLPVRTPGATTEGGGELFSFDRDPVPVPVPVPVQSEIEREPEPTPEPAAEGDDFQRLGTEVADVLRTAHSSVAQLRHEAEVEAAVIRQRADREIVDLRRNAEVEAALVREGAERDAAALKADAESHAWRLRAEADEYAARVHVDTDRDATERTAAAALALDQAEHRLHEARIAADAMLADADQRATAIVREAEVAALARKAELEAQSAKADAEARIRREDLLAEAEQRLDAVAGTEAALRARLVAAHGDLSAALARFPADVASPAPAAEVGPDVPATPPTVDLTDASGDHVVLDLTGDAADPDAEPPVPSDWPGPPPALGRVDDPLGHPVSASSESSSVATDLATPAAPAAPEAASIDADPLPDIVRNAIGRAVQSAVDRGDADPA